jgi:hypothetical protein
MAASHGTLSLDNNSWSSQRLFCEHAKLFDAKPLTAVTKTEIEHHVLKAEGGILSVTV